MENMFFKGSVPSGAKTAIFQAHTDKRRMSFILAHTVSPKETPREYITQVELTN